ncbi:low temperature requirement protein A [Micromonospora sp. NPDC049662]|uniref:low temperature requirement protein A n=1 Tax=unclassified Micromonospora TaxID=2617518 RepID=UPI003445647A
MNRHAPQRPLLRDRWPTPSRLGHERGAALEITATHIAERYRQVFIIALGEIILAMGITFTATSSYGFTPRRTVALVLAFVLAALSPVAVHLPPEVPLAFTTLVLAALAAEDTARGRRSPPNQAMPPA